MRSVDIRKELFFSGRLQRQYEEMTGCMVKMIYETVNHRIKCEAIDLSGDVKTNPGPFCLDSSKLFVLLIVKEIELCLVPMLVVSM